MAQEHPSEALTRLLIRLFSASELREFLRFGPDASDIWPKLPERAASLAELSLAAVDLLERRGSIDVELFARLRKARPKRRAEIDAVEALFHAGSSTAVPTLRHEIQPQGVVDGPLPLSVITSGLPTASPSVARVMPAVQPSPAGDRRRRNVMLVLVSVTIAVASITWMARELLRADKLASVPNPHEPEPPTLTKTTDLTSPTPPPEPTLIDVTGSPQTPVPLPAPVPITAAGAATAGPSAPAPTRPLAPRNRQDTSRKIGQAATSGLQACSDKIGAMGGQTVGVALRIDAQGKITSATASGTTYGEAFHGCVARAVQAVRLPAGQPTEHTYHWIME